MTKSLHAFWCDELGATAIDYVLIAGIVGVAAFVAMEGIGGSVTEFLGVTDEGIREALESAGDPGNGHEDSDGDDRGDDGYGN